MVRTKPNEVVNAIKDGLQRAAQAGRTRARTGNAVPLLFILLGAQKHYICLCARRTQRIAPDEAPAELDTDWDDVCRLCGRAGELICCDGAGCPRAYHPKCVGLGEDGAEDLETWRCPECTSRDLSSYSSFEHDVELLWMDSQIDRPVSERMLAVDRRTAGRNASLFHRFVTAARAESSPDPLDEDEVGGASQAAGARGGRRSSLRAQEEEEEEPAKARRRSSSRAAVVPRKPPPPHPPPPRLAQTPFCTQTETEIVFWQGYRSVRLWTGSRRRIGATRAIRWWGSACVGSWEGTGRRTAASYSGCRLDGTFPPSSGFQLS